MEQKAHRTVAIVQARLGSSRLPRKVLEPLVGEPMLVRQLERVRRATTLDQIIVATTTSQVDDELVEVVQAAGYVVHRGSELDVLDRYYEAATLVNASLIVRLTGDCPLVDPLLIDQAVEAFIKEHPNVDFVSNALSETYPDGMDVEVMSRAALERAWKEATLPSQREHVTFYLWKTGLFRVRSLKSQHPLGHLRLTVDYPADLELVSLIYERLYQNDPAFGLKQILNLLAELDELPNATLSRNSGWAAALTSDQSHSDLA